MTTGCKWEMDGGETGLPTMATDGQGMAGSCWSLDMMDGALMEVEVKVSWLVRQEATAFRERTRRKSREHRGPVGPLQG